MDNWTGRAGRITPDWVKEHVHDLPNTVFYACGPNALVEFAEEVVCVEWACPKSR